MGLLRSETMKHGTLVLPSERARAFIDILGRKANMQFVDMNAHSMQRPYKKYVQRLEEMERILRFLYEETGRHGGPVLRNKFDEFLSHDHEYQLDKVEESLKKLYEQFVKFRDNNQELTEQRNSVTEWRQVLLVAQAMFDSPRPADVQAVRRASDTFGDRGREPLLEEGGGGQTTIDMANNVAGVILLADQERFARTLFRASRGNTYVSFTPIAEKLVDAKSGKEVAKSVFIVYFLGSTTSAMFEKIKKICAAFGVSMYTIPGSIMELQRELNETALNLEETSKALEAFEKHMRDQIATLLEPVEGGNSLIEEWRLFCIKEKAIYITLNMFEGDITLRANCWYPELEEDSIRNILIEHSNQQQLSAFLLMDKQQPKRAPPTFIRRTEFSGAFQELVDTYGVPSYQEANPALFTIITFPFLFGIMYGDIGHGLCILLLGSYLLLNAERWKDDETMKGALTARYMITLMGFFAVYAGFMYNDFFAIALNLFGSRFKPVGNTYVSDGTVYPFGMDPVWKGASNELLFANSFKMKFAVLVGVTQMGLGVFLKGANAIHYRKPLDFLLEFIPQVIFLVGMFGYMDFLIVLKWITPIQGNNKPGIINLMINWALMKPMEPTDVMFDGQQTLQPWLLLVCVLTVPTMLFPKPLILWCLHSINKPPPQSRSVDTEEEGYAGEDEHEEEFEIGEVFIHQVIETIEFVLGTVSNTASYLRLWALSLAHQQLALVFFEKSILGVLEMENSLVRPIALFVAFAIFAGITFGVLLCMDVLECFLHALRLQWVEFQNKFYKAQGYRFIPYNHRNLLTLGSQEA
ncbi:unnamed protein product [Vitrella brassicaformis CCMP3155]|uniref:V-type proton ATPase subunit a n=1 Tax=Vitrella brassicaformis (strain CCMP3155) TaxID=1169540 RepID=A0A0G4GUH4_VITBC|nr:unnamed protein product [Vitrella brassicaformis CCMP3155]|mmetsp:Transcript_44713/g.111194  ORF Transcript_44713/g.111194 Transcript_44713/m.111194 type:complete len:809 (-) Transcript_44713:204-2630(-)|eukprot:CEM34423.1 unnamed protein product [Vitrella brassicaformis CCMP3155]